MTFTAENTDGFSSDELATLNAALEQLQREQPDVDEKTHSDRLNNAWVEGITLAELVKLARVKGATRQYRSQRLGLSYTLTTDHSRSSFGVPVLIGSAGDVYGVADLTEYGRGAVLVPVVDDAVSRELLARWQQAIVDSGLPVATVDA